MRKMLPQSRGLIFISAECIDETYSRSGAGAKVSWMLLRSTPRRHPRRNQVWFNRRLVQSNRHRQGSRQDPYTSNDADISARWPHRRRSKPLEVGVDRRADGGHSRVAKGHGTRDVQHGDRPFPGRRRSGRAVPEGGDAILTRRKPQPKMYAVRHRFASPDFYAGVLSPSIDHVACPDNRTSAEETSVPDRRPAEAFAAMGSALVLLNGWRGDQGGKAHPIRRAIPVRGGWVGRNGVWWAMPPHGHQRAARGKAFIIR